MAYLSTLEMPARVVSEVDSGEGQWGKPYLESKPSKDDEPGLDGGIDSRGGDD